MKKFLQIFSAVLLGFLVSLADADVRQIFTVKLGPLVSYDTVATTVQANTADAADTFGFCITGGGGLDASGAYARGGKVCAYGNEHASLAGRVVIEGNGLILIRSGTAGITIRTAAAQDLNLGVDDTSLWAVKATTHDLVANTSGDTLSLQEATAADTCMGSLTCNGASDVVTNTTCATTGSRIFLTRTSLDADTTGDYYVKSISNGVSFTVACETSDTATLNWIIFHESP